MEAIPLSSTALNWESRGYDEEDLEIAHRLFNGSCNYTSYIQHAKYHQEALVMSLFLPNSLIQFGTNWYRMIPLGSSKDSVTPPPTSSVLAPDNIGLLLMSSIFLELAQQVNKLNSRNQDPASTWSSLPTSPPPINLVAAFRPTYLSKKDTSQFISNPTNNQAFFNKATLSSGSAQYYSTTKESSHNLLSNHGSQVQGHINDLIKPRKASHNIATTPGNQLMQGKNVNPLIQRYEFNQPGEHEKNGGHLSSTGNQQFSNTLYALNYPSGSGQLPLTPMTSNKVVVSQDNLSGISVANNNEVSQHTPPPSASSLESQGGGVRKTFRKLSLNSQSIPGSALSSRPIASQRRTSQFLSHSDNFRPYSTERPISHREPPPSGLAVSIQAAPHHFQETVYNADVDKEDGNKFMVMDANHMASYPNHLAETASALGSLIKNEGTSNSLTHSSLENSKRLSRKLIPNSNPLQFSNMDIPWYTIETREFPLGISGNLVDENEKSFWDPIVEPIASSLRSYFVATVLKIFRAQRKPGKPLDARLGIGKGDGVGISEDVSEEDNEMKMDFEPTGNKEVVNENNMSELEPLTENKTGSVFNSNTDKRTPSAIADKLMELVAEYCTQNFAALDRDAKTLLNQAMWCLGAYQLNLSPTALKQFRSNYPGPTTQQLKRTHLKHCFYYARLFAHMWGGQVPISRLSNFDISPISVIKVLSASACHQVRRALDELDSRF